MFRKAIVALTTALVLGWGLPAAAQNLASNPSFEAPALANGGVLQDFIPGWSGTVSGVNNYGILRNPAQIAAQDGFNAAFINVAPGDTKGLVQAIGPVAAGERYDAQAWFGWRADNPNRADVALQLWLGGAVVGGDIVGGTLVASDAPVLVQAGWVRGAATYIVSPPQNGQVLRLRLASTSPLGSQTNFDNVSVVRFAPPPVPTMSEWALLLFGMALAGATAVYVQRRRTVVQGGAPGGLA